MTAVGDLVDMIDLYRLALEIVLGSTTLMARVIVPIENLLSNEIPDEHPLDGVRDISTALRTVVPATVDDGFVTDTAEILLQEKDLVFRRISP